jgi:DNA replication initiation complex subunit (GINS family)
MSKRMEMTYEELMSVHRQELKQTSLVKVSSDFYNRTASYLDALNRRVSEKSSDSMEVSGMLHNQLKTAKEKSSEVYEIRMRKIALMAMASAFGGEPRLDNATPEENEAFASLKRFFTEHCMKTMNIVCEAPKEPKEAAPQATEAPVTTPAIETEKPVENPTLDENAAAKSEIILVRVLEDLPAFAGMEKNYRLSKEDVISLPRHIADILVKNKKAIEVRQSS